MAMAGRPSKPVPQNNPVVRLLSEHNNKPMSTYIAHIDRTPSDQKKHVFIVLHIPVIIVTLVFLWRVLMKGEMNLYDGLLVVIIIALSASLSPSRVKYHIKHGFSSTAVVIRHPFGPKRPELNASPNTVFLQRWGQELDKALTPKLLGGPGWLSETPIWIVDYSCMDKVAASIKKGETSVRDWRTSVWHKQSGKWSSWDVWSNYVTIVDAKILPELNAKINALKGKPNFSKDWNGLFAKPAQPVFGTDGIMADSYVKLAHAIFELHGEDLEQFTHDINYPA